jgi:predicted dienelactone hydrolase
MTDDYDKNNSNMFAIECKKFGVFFSGGKVFGLLPAALLLVTWLPLPPVFAQALPAVPKPSGNYSVGTMEFSLTDNSRPETLTDDANDKRELYLRVWYPAARNFSGAAAKPLPIFGKQTKQIAQALAAGFRLPPGALDFLALVSSNSYENAPLAASKTKFPVVVFSHGYYRGFAAQNAIQMEELASHGYVVFGIGHTYETILNVFPDGRAVPAGKLLLFLPDPKTDEAVKKYAAARNPEERAAYAGQIVLANPTNKHLRVWTADVRFVLDEIERMNAGATKSIFAKKLNAKRIGLMGMSFGGAAAGQVCVEDKRCRAGINLDGAQFGDVYASVLKRPFMFMASEGQDAGINREIYEAAARADAYFLTVKGANHRNFSNLNLLSGIDRENRILGKIPAERMEKIMSGYVLAFFDKYLKNINSPKLKNGASAFSEVTFSAKTVK